MSLYKLGDVAACRRAACVLCVVQSETAACVLCAVQSEASGMCVVCSAAALHTTHMPLYDMLPHHLVYITA